ncbi:hypothetical protein Dimus_035390 [Dionaea muscipula]
MIKPSSGSMEEGKCLMWLRQHVMGPYFSATRWEDHQAFSGGGMAGSRRVVHEAAGWMAWPPRSYSCSFCKREFRSAQALGGHMNVHRRDRAMLKQIPTVEANNHDHEDQDHNQHPLIKPLGSSQGKHPAAANPSISVAGLPPKVPSDDAVQTKLAIGLGEEALGGSFKALSCKRHKSSSPTNSSLKAAPLVFLNQCGDVFDSVEELDLELRLGDPPKVS